MKGGYVLALRTIMAAMSKDNQTVAVMSSTDLRARAALRMYFEIVTPLLGEGHAKMFPQSREIRFDNGSRILFRTGEEQLRGVRVHDTVRD